MARAIATLREEQLSVVIATEDLLPAIPTRHDVVKGTGILNANTTWHRAHLLYELSLCQELMPDPHFISQLSYE